MTSDTLTLTDFLLARIAEDEAAQRVGLERRYGHGEQWHRLDCSLNDMDNLACDCGIPTRVLAECETKRRIVTIARYAPEDSGGWGFRRITRELAAVYADHPDYRDEWRP